MTDEAKTERYGAQEKCRAVLALWSERQKAAALARELGVSQALLWQWQDRALSGMLAALEPRGAREGTVAGPALAPSLRHLLERKAREREGRAPGRRPLLRRETPAQEAAQA